MIVMPTTRQPLAISVSDLEHDDLRQVLRIEQACYSTPWSLDDYYKTLQPRNRFGIVARSSKKVIGYLIVEALPKSFQVLNLAVDPKYHGRGVGRKLLSWLLDQMESSKRIKTRVEVRETNLAVQLFLRRVGFLAIDVVRNYFDDTGEDMYQFERHA